MYCMTYQGEDDADKDEGAASEAGHEEEGGGQHTYQRDTDVLVQLLPDHLHIK